MGYDASFFEKDGVLFFKMRKEAITQPAIPFEFEGPASDRHKKDYPKELQTFLDTLPEEDVIETILVVPEAVQVEMKEASEATSFEKLTTLMNTQDPT